eukprot:scaffold2070_cov105-Cylindrotheca_fusiformis.AAC.4
MKRIVAPSMILLVMAAAISTLASSASGFLLQNAAPCLPSSSLRSLPDTMDENRRSSIVLVSGISFWPLVLGGVSSTCVAPFVRPAFATSDVRAPLELLLPATRVKVYIDQAVTLCRMLREGSSDNDDGLATRLDRLKDFLDHEPSFLTPAEEKLSKRYLEIKTTEAWQKARLKEREAKGAELGIDYTTPYDKFNTALQQWGDRRQFSILRSRQRRLEQSNTIRTALNAYTNNLVFGDAYKLNAQGEEKKAMVRNDALPDVNAVVVSDLDLRDLYRNQILQNMDDAKAEIDYQVKSGDINVDEVFTYLQQAQASCDEWFNLIPKSDVEEALRTVLKEEETTRT